MARRATIGILLTVASVSALASLLDARSEHLPLMAASLLTSGFLIGLPALLAVLILLRLRWAFMAAVMYGTIGLALDISTLAQALTQGERGRLILLSALTGALNALLTVVSWQGFIGGDAPARLPGDRPPSPPSQP